MTLWYLLMILLNFFKTPKSFSFFKLEKGQLDFLWEDENLITAPKLKIKVIILYHAFQTILCFLLAFDYKFLRHISGTKVEKETCVAADDREEKFARDIDDFGICSQKRESFLVIVIFWWYHMQEDFSGEGMRDLEDCRGLESRNPDEAIKVHLGSKSWGGWGSESNEVLIDCMFF